MSARRTPALGCLAGRRSRRPGSLVIDSLWPPRYGDPICFERRSASCLKIPTKDQPIRFRSPRLRAARVRCRCGTSSGRAFSAGGNRPRGNHPRRCRRFASDRHHGFISEVPTEVGSRAETRMLAYPEEFASNRSHFSPRSPLGAASICLKPGSRMPYFTIEGWMHMVEVESVSRFAPNVIPLFSFARDAFGRIRPRSGSVCRVAIRSLQ
jgi:hypothetical protein